MEKSTVVEHRKGLEIGDNPSVCVLVCGVQCGCVWCCVGVVGI